MTPNISVWKAGLSMKEKCSCGKPKLNTEKIFMKDENLPWSWKTAFEMGKCNLFWWSNLNFECFHFFFVYTYKRILITYICYKVSKYIYSNSDIMWRVQSISGGGRRELYLIKGKK